MTDVNSTIGAATSISKNLVSNPKILIIAIILIILAIIVLYLLKNIIANSIIGVVAFLICNFLLGIKLPFVITLIVSAIFGAAGIGVMLLLKFLGAI